MGSLPRVEYIGYTRDEDLTQPHVVGHGLGVAARLAGCRPGTEGEVERFEYPYDLSARLGRGPPPVGCSMVGNPSNPPGEPQRWHMDPWRSPVRRPEDCCPSAGSFLPAHRNYELSAPTHPGIEGFHLPIEGWRGLGDLDQREHVRISTVHIAV